MINCSRCTHGIYACMLNALHCIECNRAVLSQHLKTSCSMSCRIMNCKQDGHTTMVESGSVRCRCPATGYLKYIACCACTSLHFFFFFSLMAVKFWKVDDTCFYMHQQVCEHLKASANAIDLVKGPLHRPIITLMISLQHNNRSAFNLMHVIC